MGTVRSSGGCGDRPTFRPLLRDPALEQQLCTEGFAQSPLLSRAEVDTLRDLHEQLHPAPGSGFDTDFAYVSPPHKAAVDRGIRSVVEPLLTRIFRAPKSFNVTFVVKWPGKDSRLPVHQDWAYVDERSERACTLWVPLDATSPELDNGPLGLLPRSHSLPAHRRGANSISWYRPYQDAICDHLHFPLVAIGEALVFDNRVLHGSPTNRTDRPRRAITMMVTDHDTQLVYHHMNGARWETFEIDPDFFVRHGPMDLRSDPPDSARLVETAAAEPPFAPLEELRRTCGVDLEPVEPAQAVTLTGEPLGPSEPVGPTRASRTGAALHRSFARNRTDPFHGPDDVAALSVLPAQSAILSAAWASLRAQVERVPSVPMVTRFGSWSARPLDADPEGVLGALTAPLVGSLQRSSLWIVTAGPHSELVRRRTGSNSNAMVYMALDNTQPPGTCVVQVGIQMRALEPYRPVAFDPTWEHTAWNLGAEDVPIVCGWVNVPMTRFQRLASRISMARGTSASPTPVTT